MRKKVVVSLLAMVLSVGVIGITEVKLKVPLCKDCNIVLISLDTLGAKHLPCYGYELNTAPNLCQFGKENVLFQNAYAQSYWTLPSQTSVITSTYPTTHKLTTSIIKTLDSNKFTLTETLKHNNYETWYLGPLTKDNDSWLPVFTRGFDINLESQYIKKSTTHWNGELKKILGGDKKKPKFIYLHTYYVHTPYITGHKETFKFVKDDSEYPEIPLTESGFDNFDEKFYEFVIDQLKDRIKKSDTSTSLKRNQEMLSRLMPKVGFKQKKQEFEKFEIFERRSFFRDWYIHKLENSDTRKTEYIKSLYDERIYDLDLEMKEVFRFLKENQEIAKKTIVVIYGDHGEEFMEHGAFSHCYSDYCLYDELIKVPLIMKIPGVKGPKYQVS